MIPESLMTLTGFNDPQFMKPADKNVTPTSLTDRQIQYLEARNTAAPLQCTIPYIMQVLQNQSHVIL
jgi:hypothetical protein